MTPTENIEAAMQDQGFSERDRTGQVSVDYSDLEELITEVKYLRRIVKEVAKAEEATNPSDYGYAMQNAIDYLDPEWPNEG